MLIVRDLLLAPKRFTDLLRGLPGIPTNGLTARLKDLEVDGVVRRRALQHPERSVVYELTDYGRELEETIDALGRWGAKALGDPREGEVVTLESMITAMRATFQPAAARGVRATYELRLGDVVLHLRIADRKLTVAAGPLPDADLVIESGPAIKMLISGELSARDAIAQGLVHVTGDPALLDQFARMFHIDVLDVATERVAHGA
jgi:DNA-binding HxlR family transcriptional regulator